MSAFMTNDVQKYLSKITIENFDYKDYFNNVILPILLNEHIDKKIVIRNVTNSFLFERLRTEITFDISVHPNILIEISFMKPNFHIPGKSRRQFFLDIPDYNQKYKKLREQTNNLLLDYVKLLLKHINNDVSSIIVEYLDFMCK